MYNMVQCLFTKRQWQPQPFSNQLMGAAQCFPRESWKPNEPTECASEQQTERLLVAENLLSITHTHICMIITQTHAWTHTLYTNTGRSGHTHRVIRIEMNQLAGDRHERDGGRKREWAKWANTLKQWVCGEQSERKMQLRHLHIDTFKEAEVARGESISTQWVDNVARCVETGRQTEVTLADIIHRLNACGKHTRQAFIKWIVLISWIYNSVCSTCSQWWKHHFLSS